MKICILTKSSKGDGYCVAGIDIENNSWVRIVSNELGDSIPRESMQDINILDIIECDVVKKVPIRWNKENIIVENMHVIDKLSEYELLTKYGIDDDSLLFDAGMHYVDEKNLPSLNKTLMMIHVTNGIIKTKIDSEEECIQYLEFKYKDKYYHLKITDLSYPYNSRENLTGQIIDNAIIVCSVQGKLKPNSHCYKFACQILKIDDNQKLKKVIRNHYE